MLIISKTECNLMKKPSIKALCQDMSIIFVLQLLYSWEYSREGIWFRS